MAEKLKCPECEYEAKSQSAITAHINKNHGGSQVVKIREKYKESAPTAGGILTARPLEAVPSGIPSLDYIMGIGGVPKGTMVEVFGPPKAGKTLVALAFSGHAQQNGGKIGYVDAEHALQQTFLKLIPELDPEKLEYSEPQNGEQAMNITKDFIELDEYAVWTIDSLHACVPEAALTAEIGSKAQRARLAQLMSEALPVLAQLVSRTSSILVLINHIKTNPNTTFGKDWYTPGGSAPEYYSSVRLHVWRKDSYKDKNTKIAFGHQVRVKLEKAKMSAPNAIAGFDLYYRDGMREDGIEVKAGIDYASSWIDVLTEDGRITKSGQGVYIDTTTGEKLGKESEFREMVLDPTSEIRKAGMELVYPEEFTKK